MIHRKAVPHYGPDTYRVAIWLAGGLTQPRR